MNNKNGTFKWQWNFSKHENNDAENNLMLKPYEQKHIITEQSISFLEMNNLAALINPAADEKAVFTIRERGSESESNISPPLSTVETLNKFIEDHADNIIFALNNPPPKREEQHG